MPTELLKRLTRIKEIAESLVYRCRENCETKLIEYANKLLLEEYAEVEKLVASPEGRTVCATNPTIHNILDSLFIQLYNTRIYFAKSSHPLSSSLVETMNVVSNGIIVCSKLYVDIPRPPSPERLKAAPPSPPLVPLSPTDML